MTWLLGTLSATWGANHSAWRSAFISKPTITETLRFVSHAGKILENWPTSFHGWLDDVRLSRKSELERAGLSADYGPLLQRLRRNLERPQFNWLFDEVRAYLARQWDGGHLKKWSFYAPFDKDSPSLSRIAGRQAARQLKLSQQSVATMIQTGALAGVIRAAGRRKQYIVDSDSLADAVSRRSDALNWSALSKRLGTSIFEAEKLMRAGLLGTPLRTKGGWRFPKDEIDAFEDRLRAKARSYAMGDVPPDLLRLSELKFARKISLDRVIAGILDGRLAAYTISSEPAPIMNVIGTRRREAFSLTAGYAGSTIILSEREAAMELGVAVRMMPILVDAGCLELAFTKNLTKDKVSKRSILASSIAGFNETYVLTRPIAAAYNTSTRRVIVLLRQLDVTPIVSGNSAKGISSVWRKADVMTGEVVAGLNKSARRNAQ